MFAPLFPGKSVTLFLTPTGELALLFENAKERHAFQQKFGTVTMPERFRTGPQYKDYPGGIVPRKYSDRCVCFPTYETGGGREIGVGLMDVSHRDKLIAHLGFKPRKSLEDKEFHELQRSYGAGDINLFKTFDSTTHDPHKNEGALYFSASHFSEPGAFVRVNRENGSLTKGVFTKEEKAEIDPKISPQTALPAAPGGPGGPGGPAVGEVKQKDDPLHNTKQIAQKVYRDIQKELSKAEGNVEAIIKVATTRREMGPLEAIAYLIDDPYSKQGAEMNLKTLLPFANDMDKGMASSISTTAWNIIEESQKAAQPKLGGKESKQPQDEFALLDRNTINLNATSFCFSFLSAIEKADDTQARDIATQQQLGMNPLRACAYVYAMIDSNDANAMGLTKEEMDGAIKKLINIKFFDQAEIERCKQISPEGGFSKTVRDLQKGPGIVPKI